MSFLRCEHRDTLFCSAYSHLLRSTILPPAMSYRAQKILWSPPRQRMLPEDGADAREPRDPFSARKTAPSTPETAPAPSEKWNLAPVAHGKSTPRPDARNGPTRNTDAAQDTPKGLDRVQGTAAISARPVKSVERAGDAKEKVVPSEKCSERVPLPSSEPPQPSSPLRPSRGALLPMRWGERNGHLTRRGLSCPDICAPTIRATVNCRLSTASSRSSVREELDDSAAMKRSFSLVSRPYARGRGRQRGAHGKLLLDTRVTKRQGYQRGGYEGSSWDRL